MRPRIEIASIARELPSQPAGVKFLLDVGGDFGRQGLWVPVEPSIEDYDEMEAAGRNALRELLTKFGEMAALLEE